LGSPEDRQGKWGDSHAKRRREKRTEPHYSNRPLSRVSLPKIEIRVKRNVKKEHKERRS